MSSFYSLSINFRDLVNGESMKVSTNDSVIEMIRLVIGTHKLKFRYFAPFGSRLFEFTHCLPKKELDFSPISPEETWIKKIGNSLKKDIITSLEQENRFKKLPEITCSVINTDSVSEDQLSKVFSKKQNGANKTQKKILVVELENGKLIDDTPFSHKEYIPIFY